MPLKTELFINMWGLNSVAFENYARFFLCFEFFMAVLEMVTSQYANRLQYVIPDPWKW